MQKAVQFPTGSQITMRGEEDEEGFWCGDGVYGGEEGVNWLWLLVSVNLSYPHTVFKDWLTDLICCVSCTLLPGTASSLPLRTPLPDSPHLQATSRSSSFHRRRPCQRRRRDVTSGSLNKAGQCFSAWMSCRRCGGRREGKERVKVVMKAEWTSAAFRRSSVLSFSEFLFWRTNKIFFWILMKAIINYFGN